jgi:hypothetical protein
VLIRACAGCKGRQPNVKGVRCDANEVTPHLTYEELLATLRHRLCGLQSCSELISRPQGMFGLDMHLNLPWSPRGKMWVLGWQSSLLFQRHACGSLIVSCELPAVCKSVSTVKGTLHFDRVVP